MRDGLHRRLPVADDQTAARRRRVVCLGRLLLLLLLHLAYCPVENVVILISFADKEVPEQLAQVGIVGFVIETERADVVEVDGEFLVKAAAQRIGGGGHFLLHDLVILFFLCAGADALPRQLTTAKVDENVAERLEIISTRLLNAQVGVDARVAGGAC